MNPNANPYPCNHPGCKRSFKTEEARKQHEQTHSFPVTASGLSTQADEATRGSVAVGDKQLSLSTPAKTTSSTADGRLFCSYPGCNKSYKSEDARKQHENAVHSSTLDGDGTLAPTSAHVKATNQSQVKSAGDYLSEKTHQELNANPFICSNKACNKSFNSDDARKQHEQSAHSTVGSGNGARVLTPEVEVVYKTQASVSKQTLSVTIEMPLPSELRETGIPGAQSPEPYICAICSHKCKGEKGLEDHKRTKHPPKQETAAKSEVYSRSKSTSDLPTPKTPTSPNAIIPCNFCDRKFSTKQGISDHVRTNHPDKQDTKDPETKHVCKQCDETFKSKTALMQHMSTKHNPNLLRQDSKVMISDPYLLCKTCFKSFPARQQLDAHAESKGHTPCSKDEDPHVILTEYFDHKNQTEIEIPEHDKDSARQRVMGILGQLMQQVNKDEGQIFSTGLLTAGSSAVGAKIGLPDEFDFNVPLNVVLSDIQLTGAVVPYMFKDIVEGPNEKAPSKQNMNVTREVIDGKAPIPDGYAALKTEDPVAARCVFKGWFIPHLVKQLLYKKAKNTKEKMVEKFKDVDISPLAHGPAITLTLHQKGSHNTSIDLTCTCMPNAQGRQIRVDQFGWPREGTKRVFSPQKIQKVIKEGIHLVPKGDEFWNISFSKCEKVLLSDIDRKGECRLMCHRMLKRDMQIWRSRSKTGMRGISSHVFKHQLLWMNEDHPEQEYWRHENRARCYLDMLEDLEKRLDLGKILNYFNENENIIGAKSRSDLRELSLFVQKAIEGFKSYGQTDV